MYRYRHCSLINLGKSLNQKRQTQKKDLPLLKKRYHMSFLAMIFASIAGIFRLEMYQNDLIYCRSTIVFIQHFTNG